MTAQEQPGRGKAGTRSVPKDPLAPFEFVITLALGLCIALAVLMVVSGVFGGHPSVGAWGGLGSDCLTVPNMAMAVGSSEDAQSSVLRPGMSLGSVAPTLICGSYTSLEQALMSVPVLLYAAWILGFLLVSTWLVRRARRQGLFTEELARALNRLGLYLLLGWLAVNLVGAGCQAVVMNRVVLDTGPVQDLMANLTWDWGVVFGGFGLLTVARILRQTVPMREELEATV